MATVCAIRYKLWAWHLDKCLPSLQTQGHLSSGTEAWSGAPSAIPFVQLSVCLQNASQKHTATILPRNHITDIQIFSAFYTLSHLLKSHSTHMQLTTHLSKFNSTAVS